METSCVFIQQGGPCLRERKLVDDAINMACLLVNEIMCEFTIPAPLFKKTVHMATTLLPSLCRGFAQRCYAEKVTRCDTPTAFFKNMSIQALQILRDRSSGCAISWSRPSGLDEMLCRDEEDIESEPDKLTNGIPLEISIPSTSVARTALQNNAVIKFANEAAWSHALNALFTAVDRAFAVPSLAWQECENVDRDNANLLQYPGYLFWRRDESSLFLDLDFECPLLARADIIAIVAAWTSDDTLDVIAGARRWFQAERCGSAKNHSPELDVGAVRLPKTMIRVDELESVLQKLDAAIANLKDKKNNPQARRLQLVDDTMVLALYNDSVPSELQRNFSLSHAVADCLKSASASRADGYMNVYAQSEGTQPGDGDFGRKRKRQNALARRMRRERKQPIPRSRNPVIDLYQQLDYDDAYDDDDEYDDAYADLEGFLVEG
ncbi:hypothetical protein MHU86_15604 [Fragilaria crotonensis]|nr:hypothetical protein MHU86_15604 [Fragilaria crotonensis]